MLKHIVYGIKWHRIDSIRHVFHSTRVNTIDLNLNCLNLNFSSLVPFHEVLWKLPSPILFLSPGKMDDLWCLWVLRIDRLGTFPNTPHSLVRRYYHFSVWSLVINSGESWKEASRGWTSCFISSHSSEAGWSLGQGSRTSKARKRRRLLFLGLWQSALLRSLVASLCQCSRSFPSAWPRDKNRLNQNCSWECSALSSGNLLPQTGALERHPRIPVLAENRQIRVQTPGELVPD